MGATEIPPCAAPLSLPIASPLLSHVPHGNEFSLAGSHGGGAIDSGGCTAIALVKLGLFELEAEARTALNREMPWFASKGRRDLAEYAGTVDVSWHPRVVQKVVTERGFHFRKVELATTCLTTEFKKGAFLVDGILNDEYKKLVRGKYKTVRNHPMDKTSPRTKEGAWRHCVAVVDGRVLDGDSDVSARWLWLHGSKPQQHGYFYKVLR